MNYKDIKIVFLGTPDFAVASLDALVKAGCNIVGVVTAPDKPAGRGMKLSQSAVKQYALANNLRVLQPERLKAEVFINELRTLKADLQVVVAFRMLPEVVWNMPPMGTINVHGSLLPAYRGAAPINWAIINGEKVTGVTTFRLKHEIDTGDILQQREVFIEPEDNVGSVHDKMKIAGAHLLVETIRGLADGSLKERPQTSEEASNLPHAPKIFTETCRINWNKPAQKVLDLIRGLSPYPGAFTILNGKTLKIYSALIEETKPGQEPGTVSSDGKTYLKFAAGDALLNVLELQLEGKTRMKTADFLRGYRFHNSEVK